MSESSSSSSSSEFSNTRARDSYRVRTQVNRPQVNRNAIDRVPVVEHRHVVHHVHHNVQVVEQTTVVEVKEFVPGRSIGRTRRTSVSSASSSDNEANVDIMNTDGSQRHLLVLSIELSDLPKMDVIGWSDPYVRVYLDNEFEFSTSVQEDTAFASWSGYSVYIYS